MLCGSPSGSVMSCQSLTTAARSFTEPDKENTTNCSTFHRSVRFSSESRASTRRSAESECKREAPGSMSMTALSIGSPMPNQQLTTIMSQSAPPSSTIDLDDISEQSPSCRFPKLEDCAHFHYERVSLGGIRVETVPCEEDGSLGEEPPDKGEGWICLKVRSHVNDPQPPDSLEMSDKSLNASWAEESDVCEWSLRRSAQNLLQLDDMLHRCIYDRKVSGLVNLSEEINASVLDDRLTYESLISDYVHHLSIIADDTINCGPILNWLQMDNKGHKLLVANEDSSSINTPAVAAAYSVRKYVSQARDEISFEVGDMISIIDMPGPSESQWWRGKRGFRVGFFPHHCVAVIGDKVPRHMAQPPPIVGSVAVSHIKPVLRKHGKLISLFRSFILSRPSRRSLKQQGILRERVFGCDLGEHLLNCGHDVPQVLKACARGIEARGAVDGVYRLSGGAGLTQRLRAALDEPSRPELPDVAHDVHALASLLKMYFRELPNPLCTYQLYDSFVNAVQSGPDESVRLKKMRETIVKLPPPHYRTLAYLMRHLRRVSLHGAATGMTARNVAIVWAPNLLRAPEPHHALQGVAVQAVVTEFLICYAEELFSGPQGEVSVEADSEAVTLRTPMGHEAGRRAKSLPPTPPTKLLSLEEARRRGKNSLPPAPPAAPAPAPHAQLRPSTSMRPKYIEVGSGPNNLPQYHTVLDLPAPNKRGLKRSPSGWRGLFSRSKQQRARPAPPVPPVITHVHSQSPAGAMTGGRRGSLESVQSRASPVAPGAAPRHARSSSCDSYFEPWQAELAGMRLRLSPQERDGNIFSEEDDTTLNVPNGLQGSLCSTPVCSDPCSVEPSPRKALTLCTNIDNADRKCNKIEEQLSSIGYIDSTESPIRLKAGPEKRHSDEWPSRPRRADEAKRLCKDRDSTSKVSLVDLPTPLGAVKLRERNSPRKTRNTSRYSGLHQPLNLTDTNVRPVTVNSACQNQPRMSWHGSKEHSTLIKIDWPLDNSVNSLTASTVNSSPLTPITPVYDPLESDSDHSEVNRRTNTSENACDSCQNDKKCLKCELNECTEYENIRVDFKIGLPVTPSDEPKSLRDSLEPSPIHSTDISYQNLNRLSALSTNSSNSDPNSAKKHDGSYENFQTDKRTSIMTSSHESSSGYSNLSPSKPGDELYECYSFNRPNYINLQSGSTSKSSSTSPLKSPLRSTISITFKSPTKSSKSEYEPLHNNDRDSMYEDIDLEKNLSIVEEATVPQTDGNLPTQQACQPESVEDLIILETPTEEPKKDNDIYSQVKFFKRSVDEVNALVLESPELVIRDGSNVYENVPFPVRDVTKSHNYVNVEIPIAICDKIIIEPTNNIESLNNGKELGLEVINDSAKADEEHDNGNFVRPLKKNLNVRQLANRFESPTEQKGPFNFDKHRVSTVERSRDEPKISEKVKKDVSIKVPPPVSPKTYKLSKNSVNARSLDENAFVKEFGSENSQYADRRRSMEVKESMKKTKLKPDLNLNLDEVRIVEEITPTTENKISLIQRFDDTKLTESVEYDEEKKLSRERIEKYKEERRNFLREKYSSQSFRSSNPSEHLTRLKLKKSDETNDDEKFEGSSEGLPKFERRNTVDLGQRMRFSLAKSANNLDVIHSPDESRDGFSSTSGDKPLETCHKFESVPRPSANFDRKEKMSPSYHIKDMAAMFEQKQHTNTG